MDVLFLFDVLTPIVSKGRILVWSMSEISLCQIFTDNICICPTLCTVWYSMIIAVNMLLNCMCIYGSFQCTWIPVIESVCWSAVYGACVSTAFSLRECQEAPQICFMMFESLKEQEWPQKKPIFAVFAPFLFKIGTKMLFLTNFGIKHPKSYFGGPVSRPTVSI